MNDWESSKDKEINLKHRNKLDELRERQQQRLNEIKGKATLQAETVREKLDADDRKRLEEHRRRVNIKEMELDYRSEENEATAIARASAGLELESLRHELREAERMPNFEDFKMRAELEFLIRRQERLDGNKLENYALERRITEMRALNRSEVHKLVLLSVLEHIQGEHIHRRTLQELQEGTEADMMRAEQAHGHQIEQDNNASRLRVSEMFSSRFLDVIFSQMGGQVSGLSRTDIDAMVSEWEKEGDRLKK